MANQGSLYGFSKDCKAKAESKFSANQALAVIQWIEAVLDRKLHPELSTLRSERDFAAILRDGTVLCDLMNAISPGAIERVHRQGSEFKQMENLEQFTRACLSYGLQSMDVFQVADLYDVKATYTVYNCLHALGSMARTNGFKGPSFGVKVSDKKTFTFSASQLADSRRVIPMQAGTNQVPSQTGMSPYGLARQIVPADRETSEVPPISSQVVSLQYGTNATASQKGMTPYGLTRQIVSSTSTDYPPSVDDDDEQRDSDVTSLTSDPLTCNLNGIEEQMTLSPSDGDELIDMSCPDDVTSVDNESL